MKSALLALLFIPTAVHAALASDPLTILVNNSDLVVVGRISSHPAGVVHEVGVVNYSCSFVVSKVLKTSDKFKEEAFRVTIVEMEFEKADHNPLVAKDTECILFLKHQPRSIPEWATSDLWFSVQSPKPSLMHRVEEIVKNKRKVGS